MTRIEVVCPDGGLAGLFFTRLSVEECRSRRHPSAYMGVCGHWFPAGGFHYDSFGANAWYNAPVTLGDVVEVPDTGR